MRCDRCGASSLADTALFCSNCGNALRRACQACGTEAAPNARFCAHCGKSLAHAAPPPEPTPPPAPEPPPPAAQPPGAAAAGGERRQITVMFCDIVNSTALADRLDPEEMQELEQQFRRCCVESTERNEGVVSRFAGDGLVIHFGLPAAHEDDAARAVNTALEIMRRLSELDTSRLLSGDLPPLQARIGIATGDVVVAEAGLASGTSAITGIAFNHSARLQTLAGPGQIVISDLTHQLVSHLFATDDMGAHELKGFARPERVWQVLGEGHRESRFEAREGAGELSVFVGRAWEADLMRERFAKALEGQGSTLLISGEAGIGKSRLIEQFRADIAGADVWRLRYFCEPRHVDTPFFPIIDQLRRAAGIEPAQTPETKLARLARVLGPAFSADPTAMTLFAELLSIPISGIYPDLGLSPQARRRRTLELLEAVSVNLAASKPVVMLLEDAHWVDPSTAEVTERIAHLAANQPLLQIVTARPEFRPNWIDLPRVTFLALNRMDQHASVQIAESVAGGKTLPTQVINEIIARTDGVPLFVEELTKALLESGSLEADGNAYRLKGDLYFMAVPNTLRASLTARLDRLGGARAVAQTAAVIGRSCPFPLLASVSGMAEPDLIAALDSLVAADMMVKRGTPPDATFTFRHALVQDTAYGTLLRARRAALHRRVAEVLTTQDKAARIEEPAVLAHHYAESGQTGLAIACLEEASVSALSRSNYVEGVAILRRALDLLATQPESVERNATELRLQTALGGALIVTHGFAAPEVGAAFHRAGDLCREIGGDAPNLNPIRYGVAVYHLVRREFDQARRLGEDFVRDAGTDPAHRIIAHRTLGNTLVFMGEWHEGLRQVERAIDLYDRARHGGLAVIYAQDPRIAALTNRTWPLFFTGRLDEAREARTAAAAEARAFGHIHTEAYCLGLAGVIVAQFLGDVPEVRRTAHLLAEVCARQPMPIWAFLGQCLEGWAVGMNGDVESGLLRLRRGYDGIRATGATLFLPYYNALMAEVHAAGGQYSRAVDALEEAARQNAESEEGWFAAELDRISGDIHAAASDPAAARLAWRRGLARAEAQGGVVTQLRCATGLLEVADGAEDAASAHARLDVLYRQIRQGLDTAILLRARRALAASAATRLSIAT